MSAPAEIIAVAPEINLTPQRLDLRLYAGDGAILNLRFVQDGEPIPMNDGELTGEIRTNRTDAEPIAVWAVDDSQAQQGVIVLSLTGAQTRELQIMFEGVQLGTGWKGVWDVQWKQTGSEPLTIFQGNCYCEPDVTR
jgi:hypothetical protein